jgi:polyribonucleotide nucleotidyltransferase
VRDKLQRRDAISAIKKDVVEALAGRVAAEGWNPAELSKEFGELEYRTMRDSVLDTKVRIDGRALDTVRPIAVNRRAAAHPRFLAVHPRRNPGHRDHHPGHRP